MVNLVENKNKMEKNKEKHPSDSEKQISKEFDIRLALKQYFEREICLNIEKKTIPIGNIGEIQFKVQPDVCDTENRIFGEIYVCGDTEFKAGQKNKVGKDLLKLIAIEKTFANKIKEPPIRKLIVFTSYDSNIKNEIRKDTDLMISKKLLGSASWKIKVIELFGFEVLIYFLSEIEKAELDATRKKQGENNKKK
jgi:hypothetical protein